MKEYKKQNKENFFKSRNYCKCGRFLYEEKEDSIYFSRAISAMVKKQKIILKCKCGEKTEVKL